jgi:hypothetical protein
MSYFSGNLISGITEPEQGQIREKVKEGRFSFLWAEDGTQATWDI